MAGRVATLAACALVVAGCGSSVTASPTPSFEVHILNEISNVVLFGGGVSTTYVGSPPPASQGLIVVRACGGQADVPITAGAPSDRVLLGMRVDSSGQLAAALATENDDLGQVPAQAITDTAIMWSSGEVSQTIWLTVTPTEVVQSFTPPPPAPSLGQCSPWVYG